MKRYGNIYPKIYEYQNLQQAHHNARKGKSFYSEVQMVNTNEKYYLSLLQDMLVNKTYKTSKYHVFKIKDKGKEREIYKLPYFPDRTTVIFELIAILIAIFGILVIWGEQ